MRSLRSVVVVLIVALCASPASGQVFASSDPGAPVRTRADLERLLEEYTQMLSSPVYAASMKQAIREDADQIRMRLVVGDFRVGDYIAIDIQGETLYPDTLPVESGPVVVLPDFGEISLAGVLRSEISDHLKEELSRFLRDPVVRATALMRVAILGAVGQPGYYNMPAEYLLSQALMAAGGPGQTTDVSDIRIERGTETLMSGESLQEAIRQGLTLDQLNLQAGDQIVVPGQSTGGRGFFGTLLAITGAIGSISFLLWRIL